MSFTDDAGNEESLTSTSTVAVNATVPGTPRSVDVRISGTGQLAVSWEAPAFDGGSDITGYTIQWKEATGGWDSSTDVSTATTTANSYTISGLSQGTEYTVRVTATNLVGDGRASAEESPPPNSPATGRPIIRGTAEVGETLTVDISGIADEDGMRDVEIFLYWVRNHDPVYSVLGWILSENIWILGEEVDANYEFEVTWTAAGKTLTAEVYFIDNLGHWERVWSEPTKVEPGPLSGFTLVDTSDQSDVM